MVCWIMNCQVIERCSYDGGQQVESKTHQQKTEVKVLYLNLSCVILFLEVS